MLADKKLDDVLEQIKRNTPPHGQYEEMNPFLCGVERSKNVRVNHPLSRIYPYTEK